MNETRWQRLILLLYLLLGLTYAFVTPPFEASDELWHYPMVRHLADGGALPVQDPANVGPWKQEASQPPLYYALAAALTFWIDTSDFDRARWLNPHVDNGVITPDGNINLAIHDPAASRWRGTLQAVTIVRVASVVLGLATVWATYRLGKLAAPDRPEVALGAMALNAFTPMFLFISGAVNNDNLAVPLTSVALLLLARQVIAGDGDRRREWLLAGIVIGLAALTKEGTLALIPLALGTAFVVVWREEERPDGWGAILRLLPRSLGRFLWVLAPTLILAGWWYGRNVQLYGDWLGWSAFLDVLGRRAHPASLAQLWDERWGFLLSYWGLFGGVNVPLPTWIYRVLNGMIVVALLGFPGALWRGWPRVQADLQASGRRSLPARILVLIESQFALVLCLLLSLAVVYGVVQWATVTWSSQGRLVFTAISALNVLLALGLAGWLPARPGRVALGLAGGFLFGVSLAAPFAVIRPAYTPRPAGDVAYAHRLDLAFGGRMRLAGFEVEPETVQPGETVTVRLGWEALAPMQRDWSVFVHLQDPVLGAPIAQRDMYPGQGLMATRLLRPGDRLADEYVLRVPASAIAPAELRLVVGLYDLAGGERLMLPDGSDAADLAPLTLAPRPGELPNPLDVDFERQLRLVGFAVEERAVAPGQAFALTLYWEAARPPERDYTFFVQVLGEAERRWAAADIPVETTAWPVGVARAVEFPMVVDAGTPAGVYPIIVGVYSRTPDGGFDRLQTVTAEGRLADDFTTLTPIRVAP